MKIGIIGYGFVGKATEYLLQRTDAEIVISDPALGYEGDISECKYAFLCVPTPLNDNILDMSILTEVYVALPPGVVPVVRSTIGPDQVTQFPHAIMMPEFLREQHWKEDVDDLYLPIVLGDNHSAPKLYELIGQTEKELILTSPFNAMMYKLARNSALAIRVGVANELHAVCERYGAQYNDLQEILCADPIIGGSHWDAPGPDKKFGFGGKCLPKDLTHMASMCYNTHNVFETTLKQNLTWRNKNVVDG
tara:strand:- start:4492 stop:5238 length:747 start_codon:yes stop_codon:yes gene_type:complete